MVVVGAAGNDPAAQVYTESDSMGGICVANFRLGDLANGVKYPPPEKSQDRYNSIR